MCIRDRPKTHSSRLQFSEAERATPELQNAIKKSDKAADCLDAARAAIPKQTKSGVGNKEAHKKACEHWNEGGLATVSYTHLYMCSNNKKNKKCSSHRIKEADLESRVFDTLRDMTAILLDADEVIKMCIRDSFYLVAAALQELSELD